MRDSHKTKANAIGFGAIALYCLAIGFIAWGVYGFDSMPLVNKTDDKASNQPLKGKVLIATEDRVRCREYTLDNETQQMIAGSVTYCDQNTASANSTATPFTTIRDSFRKH